MPAKMRPLATRQSPISWELHIRHDPATDWHDHPATLSHVMVAGLAHFNVTTYSHFKTAIDP